MTISYSQISKSLLFVGVMLLISACGLKGDLYLPEGQPEVVGSVAETTPVIAESEDESLLGEVEKSGIDQNVPLDALPTDQEVSETIDTASELIEDLE